MRVWLNEGFGSSGASSRRWWAVPSGLAEGLRDVERTGAWLLDPFED
jgi:hypothetical protein